MKKIAAVFLFISGFNLSIVAQFGVGMTYGMDFYQHMGNPQKTDSIKYGQGSAILNFNIGPKVFIGNKKFSVSMEAQLGFAPLSFDVNEYKGMGSFYFPAMVSINYGGLTGFAKKGVWGFSLAAGTQFTRTDLYFVKDEFENLQREFYQTYFGQVNLGLGMKQAAAYFYLRFGSGDMKSYNVHAGFMIDANFTRKKKMSKSTLPN